jgi:hypothetical protein
MIAATLAGGVALAQQTDRDAVQVDGDATEGEGDASAGSGAGGWTTRITVEGLVLQRDDIANTPLTKANRTTSPFVEFETSEIDVGEAAGGIRASVETKLWGVPVEFSGFYLSPIQGRAVKENLNASATPLRNRTDAVYTNTDFGPIDPFFRYSDDIYAMVVEHQTDLGGAEANLRDAFGLNGLLLGARTIYLSEKFSSSTHDRIQSFLPVTDDPPRSDGTSIRSDNLLTGVQIGYQGMFDLLPNLSIGGSAKVGAYANYIDVESTFKTLSPSGSAPLRSRVLKDADDVGYSTAVELNPRVDLRISDGVVMTASGTFLWINNISEAMEYFDEVASASSYKIRNGGDAFFYGASLGLRFEMEKLGANLANAASAGSLKDSGSGETFVASPEEIEERVAALESEAVSKGNRKVSLNVYGQVNKMLMWWNDGEQKDVYVVDNGTSGTRLGFEGEGRISRALKTGFNLNFRINDTRSNNVSQIDDDGDEGILETRFAELWLQHNLYGRVTLGQTSTATDDMISANLGGTGGIVSADIALIGGAMRLRRRNLPYENLISDTESTRGTTMRAFVRDLDTSRRDGIRWDSDRYYGFTVSAFWGENDFWDVGLTYARSFSDWRVRFRVGYLEDTDGEGAPGKTLITDLKGSAAILHEPSGIFINAAYIHREFEGDSEEVSTPAQFGNSSVGLQIPAENFADFNYYYTQGGLRKKWSDYGETSIFGEYAEAHDGLTGREVGGFDRVTDSKLTMVGAGIVQNFDSAELEIYGGFRYFKYDIEGIEGGGSTPAPLPADAEAYEDLSIVYAGTRIKF